jgi:four helix bundle protein
MEERVAISSYRDLRVWQQSMTLVEDIYKLTQGFPRHEVYGLAGQLQRAAVSIPANIAEGHTRYHGKEYLHHLSMARASLAELETEAEIAVRLSYLNAEQHDRLQEQARVLGRQLNALRTSLARRISPPSGPSPTPDT